jgi:hypothetical protein
MAWLKAQVNVQNAQKAAKQQARAHQKHASQSDFCYHQRGARPLMLSAVTGSMPTVLQCLLRCLYRVLLVAITTDRAHAEIHFDDFASGEGRSLVGDARVSGKVLRITRARAEQSGAFWFREKQSVLLGFDTTFQFQLTNQDRLFFRGADGFAFVLQNSGPEALGGLGSAGGFGVADSIGTPSHAGIPWAVAVFFGTYRNEEEADPSSNYIGDTR